MFVGQSNRRYSSDGQQQATGRFLVLFCDVPGGAIYGAVRRTCLRQLGHFMMGTLRIGSQSISVSGCYGNDGLPGRLEDIEEHNQKHLIRMPAQLETLLWLSKGWNGPGKEESQVHDWGISIDKGRSKIRITMTPVD